MSTPLDRMDVRLDAVIRLCTEEDLPGLELFGWFTQHRELFREEYERHMRGEVRMLVAEVNGWIAGQVWVDLAKPVPLIYALRVFPLLHGCGVGTRLVHVAERITGEAGFVAVEIGAEKDNPGALRLYQRLGYRIVREQQHGYDYVAPDGTAAHVPIDEWVLRKPLLPRSSAFRADDRKR